VLDGPVRLATFPIDIPATPHPLTSSRLEELECASFPRREADEHRHEQRSYNVLFLCTANSARSILAEVLLSHLGRGRFRAFSAGSHPGGRVNPLAIQTLKDAGLDTSGLRSKSWDEFATPNALHMDLILTVCDNAAGEVCPIWPGRPITAHWGVADPASVEGTEAEQLRAFKDAAAILRRRIEYLINLPRREARQR
jgi:arsenate reductase